jgi:hypothetical protein
MSAEHSPILTAPEVRIPWRGADAAEPGSAGGAVVATPALATTNGEAPPKLAADAPSAATAGWGTLREWLQLVGYGFAAYTVMFVLKTASEAGWQATHGQHIAWGGLIQDRLLEEYTCALFFAPLFIAVRRWPLHRPHLGRNLAILSALSLSFVVIKYALVLQPIQLLISPATTPTLLTTLVSNTIPVLIDFWAVIGVAHAVEFYRRAKARELVAADLRARLSRAQLEVLRAQLHPHFLFNTLNTIATLVHRDPDGADRMVTDLADLLRATLEQPASQEITLAAELDLLDRYVGIVRGRFRDRLTVEYAISADSRDVLVPQFLLQPLVENALEHGIARRPGRGLVRIAAECTGHVLSVSVQDDGPGLGTRESNGHGVGLANIRSRLTELYGADGGLALEPASPAGGAVATVMLPIRRAPGAVNGAR